MSLLSDVILAPDTRANQPAATTVPAGTLYYVTDESLIERSNGTTWATYSGSGGGSGDIIVVEKELTNAEVLAIGAGGGTSIEIVAAAGANIIIVPISCVVFQDYTGGAAYSFGRSWLVHHDGHDTSPLCRTTASCTDQTLIHFWNITQERNTAAASYAYDPRNLALHVNCNATHASGGNAVNLNNITCSYYLLDVS